jgi:hypothetical protein
MHGCVDIPDLVTPGLSVATPPQVPAPDVALTDAAAFMHAPYRTLAGDNSGLVDGDYVVGGSAV